MIVAIPSVLQSYTHGARAVTAEGRSLAELLDDLDARFPGIRFRMVNEADELRPHMRIFVNGVSQRDLGTVVSAADEVVILQALSGG